jgi:uncharacterized protein involved in response to NO
MFGVFSRNLTSKVVFIVLAFAPAISSAQLAWHPRSNNYVRYASIVLALFTVMLSCRIVYAFVRCKLQRRNNLRYSFDDEDVDDKDVFT